jgi:hypothetical protein
MWHSRMYEYRYLYPILPAVLWFGIHAATHLTATLKRQALARAVVILLGAALIAPLLERVPLLRERVGKRVAEASHPCLEVGQWLQHQLPVDTPIAYDHYAYVPSPFTRVRATWGMTQEALDELQATVMVTTHKLRERYAKREDAEAWRQGKDRFLASHDFYRAVESGASQEWREVATFPACHGARIYFRDDLKPSTKPVAPSEPAFIPGPPGSP